MCNEQVLLLQKSDPVVSTLKKPSFLKLLKTFTICHPLPTVVATIEIGSQGFPRDDESYAEEAIASVRNARYFARDAIFFFQT